MIREPPSDIRPFKQFFRVPLRFDAEQSALVFTTNCLSRPLPEADAEQLRQMQENIDTLEAVYGEDFPSQLRSALRSALLTSHCRADQVAVLFSLHVRTLHRRRHAHGSGFQVLADEGRHEIAMQLLADAALGVSQIAAARDYFEGSAFMRAFRRWTGTTPARWRERRQAATNLP